MKLVVKRAPFAAGLAFAAQVTPLRSVRPILKNALLGAAADGTLEIQATDMEVGLRYTLKAESVSEPSTLCLPCGTLAGLLGECTEDVVTLDTEGAKGVLKIGRDRFEIIGQESSDFPEVVALGEGTTIKVPAGEMKGIIDRTLFSAAREQGRYAINGLYLQAKEKLFEAVATDGRRLAYCKLKLKGAAALEEGVIVPVKMMQEVRKLCEIVGDAEELLFGVRGRQIVFQGGPLVLTSVLVEGIFPKYQQVIPKDCDREITFKREALAQALRKASFLTSDETKAVALTFTDGTCLIETQSPDKGQAAVTVEVEYSGPKMTISFNPQYLTDCLKAIATESLRLEIKDGTRPGVLREGTDYLYVLMPVGQRD